MLTRTRKPISIASRMACKLVLLSTFTLTLVPVLGIIPHPKVAEIRRKTIMSENAGDHIVLARAARRERDD